MAGTVNRANYGWLFLIPRNCLNYHNIYLFAMNILCLTIIQMKRFSFFYRLRRFRFELRIFFQIVRFLCLVFIFQIQIVHGVFCLWSSWKKIKDNCTHCVQPQHADLTLGATGNGEDMSKHESLYSKRFTRPRRFCVACAVWPSSWR